MTSSVKQMWAVLIPPPPVIHIPSLKKAPLFATVEAEMYCKVTECCTQCTEAY